MSKIDHQKWRSKSAHFIIYCTEQQRFKNAHCIAPEAILSLFCLSGFGGDIAILTCQAQPGLSRPRPQSGRSHINSEPLLKFFLDTTVQYCPKKTWHPWFFQKYNKIPIKIHWFFELALVKQYKGLEPYGRFWRQVAVWLDRPGLAIYPSNTSRVSSKPLQMAVWPYGHMAIWNQWGVNPFRWPYESDRSMQQIVSLAVGACGRNTLIPTTPIGVFFAYTVERN